MSTSTLNYKALLADAYYLATLSPDNSTQIGSFLVSHDEQVEWLTRAYNKPVNGWVMTEKDWERPAKYALLEHAERNAIYQAGLYGICTAGATLVASWAGCSDCCRAIVQSGIKKLVRHKLPDDGATARWSDSISIGDEILKVGSVEILEIVGPISNAPKVLRDGLWVDPSFVDNWHNHQDEE